MQLERRPDPSAKDARPWLAVDVQRGLTLGLLVGFLFGAWWHATAFDELWLKVINRFDDDRPPAVAPPPLPSMPALALEIPNDGFQRLRYLRDQALARGVLVRTPDDVVKAKLRVDGTTVDVEVRLKGDHTDHLVDEKRWSYRVRVKGAATVLGVRTFSLQSPETRRGTAEWAALRLMRREGILAPDYRFVSLDVNGEALGTYALEPHFDKYLLESQARRDAPILKLDEAPMWERLAALHDATPRAGWFDEHAVRSDAGNAKALLPRSFDDDDLTDAGRRDVLVSAAARLAAFTRGELAVDEVFDVERLATHHALSELMGSQHGLNPHNRRFAVDPLSGRLEPIAFDTSGGALLTTVPEALRCGLPCDDDVDRFPLPGAHDARLEPVAVLLHDRTYVEAYLRALDRLLAPGWLEDARAALDGERATWERAMRYPSPPFFDNLERNRAVLRVLLDGEGALRAHPGRVPGTLDVMALSSLPLVVDAVTDGRCARALPAPLTVRGRRFDEALAPIALPIPDGACTLGEAVRVRYHVVGRAQLHEAPLEAWSLALPARSPRAPRLPAVPGVVVEDAGRRVAVSGVVTLDDDLVTPRGGTLELLPGAHVTLTDGASIVVQGALHVRGTASAPVLVASAGGGGLLVVGGGSASTVAHAVFEGLAPPSFPGLAVTGAVTFVDADVRVSHARFVAAAAEDALNLVRVRFALDHVTIADARSDALDVDFGEGELTDSTFLRCGNDCVDVSGTVVNARQVSIDGAGDKGVSVGEASTATLLAVEIANVGIGVAAKDRSRVDASRVRVREARVVFAVFEKKPELGPARMLSRLTPEESRRGPHLVEDGSALSLDGEDVAPNAREVREELYGR